MDIKKYLSIREVSARVQIKEHTLRYWEKEKLLKPERFSGLRKYSQRDIDLIYEIKDLLYNKKLTISGVKKVLKGARRHFRFTGVTAPSEVVLVGLFNLTFHV